MSEAPEHSADPGDHADNRAAALAGLPDAENNVALVYDNLRQLARKYLGSSYQNQEIEPTTLVHEAFLKLKNVKDLDEASRTKYFAYAAKAMREILLNHYRKRSAIKRGGNLRRTTFDESSIISINRRDDVLDLDEALKKLQEIDEFRANIVEMRFFGGMTIKEIAVATGYSQTTIKTKWAAARIWLRCELAEMRGDTSPGDNAA